MKFYATILPILILTSLFPIDLYHSRELANSPLKECWVSNTDFTDFASCVESRAATNIWLYDATKIDLDRNGEKEAFVSLMLGNDPMRIETYMFYEWGGKPRIKFLGKGMYPKIHFVELNGDGILDFFWHQIIGMPGILQGTVYTFKNGVVKTLCVTDGYFIGTYEFKDVNGDGATDLVMRGEIPLDRPIYESDAGPHIRFEQVYLNMIDEFVKLPKLTVKDYYYTVKGFLVSVLSSSKGNIDFFTDLSSLGFKTPEEFLKKMRLYTEYFMETLKSFPTLYDFHRIDENRLKFGVLTESGVAILINLERKCGMWKVVGLVIVEDGEEVLSIGNTEGLGKEWRF